MIIEIESQSDEFSKLRQHELVVHKHAQSWFEGRGKQPIDEIIALWKDIPGNKIHIEKSDREQNYLSVGIKVANGDITGEYEIYDKRTFESSTGKKATPGVEAKRGGVEDDDVTYIVDTKARPQDVSKEEKVMLSFIKEDGNKGEVCIGYLYEGKWEINDFVFSTVYKEVFGGVESRPETLNIILAPLLDIQFARMDTYLHAILQGYVRENPDKLASVSLITNISEVNAIYDQVGDVSHEMSPSEYFKYGYATFQRTPKAIFEEYFDTGFDLVNGIVKMIDFGELPSSAADIRKILLTPSFKRVIGMFARTKNGVVLSNSEMEQFQQLGKFIKAFRNEDSTIGFTISDEAHQFLIEKFREQNALANEASNKEYFGSITGSGSATWFHGNSYTTGCPVLSRKIPVSKVSSTVLHTLLSQEFRGKHIAEVNGSHVNIVIDAFDMLLAWMAEEPYNEENKLENEYEETLL